MRTGNNYKEDTKINKGIEIYKIAERLFPICRSITGDGVRETLSILKEYVPEIEVHEIPSGKQAFDWAVPKEWNCKAAYIEDENGEKIIDMEENNLHVLGYSVPVDRWVELDELKQYIYTQPEQPDVIPYVTSYYKERYGFCMTQKQLDALQPGRYHMKIDATLENGFLTYGECIVRGTYLLILIEKRRLLLLTLTYRSLMRHEAGN